MLEPLAACKSKDVVPLNRSLEVAGSIETSDPVSIRNRVLLVRSKIKMRRLSCIPSTPADSGEREISFFGYRTCTVRDNLAHDYQTCDGTSIFHHPQGAVWIGTRSDFLKNDLF